MLIERDLAAKNLGTLPDFIAARRPRQSWQQIAGELSDASGRHVSHETLRRWFADRITVEVKVQ